MYYGTIHVDGKAFPHNAVERQGLQATVASWQGMVRVELRQEITKVDWVRIILCDSGGNGTNKVLYSGPIGGPA